MKRFILLFLILFVFVGVRSKASTVFDVVVNQIKPRLKLVEGSIIKVKGRTVVLNRGSDDGLFKNYFVFIYRNMGSFVPLTSNKPVELKKGIAFATVVKVFRHKSIAKITQGIEREKKYLFGLGIIPYGERELFGKPRVGDKWVAGKSSFRIAIITRNPYIYKGLKDALEKTGRFFVISPDKIQIALVKHRINTLYEKKAIKKLANVLDADMVMLVSTIKYEKLRYKLYNGYSAKVIIRNTVAIDNKTQVVLKQTNVESVPPTNLVASNLRLKPKLTFWETLLSRFGLYSPYTNLDMSSETYKVVLYKNIGYGTTAFYLGKIDDKNGNIILVAQNGKITAYRFDIDSFDRLFSFNFGYNIINIDAAKIGGNYMIAISNFNRYGKLSSALGYIKDKKFHITKKDIPYHIRFYNRFSKNPILIAQKASVSEPFFGSIYTLNIQSMRVSKLKLPVKPHSFYEFYRVKNDIVYVDSAKELAVYNTVDGKITSKTPYTFGGGERAIQRYPEQFMNEEMRSAGYKPAFALQRKVYIPKSLRVIRSGNDFLVLGVRNYLSHNITISNPHYQGYNIKMFSLDNDKLKLTWSSGDVKGRLVGFGKDGNYIISVIGLPASFFYRFIRGILEVDRLTAAQIEH